jgi:hypothetical protein
LILPVGLATGEVNLYITERQELMLDWLHRYVREVRELRFPAADRSAHPGEQLFRAERLCDVVIRAELEEEHFVRLFGNGAHYHYRY